MRRRSIDNKNPAQKLAKNMSMFAFVLCLVVIGVIFWFQQHKNGVSEKAGQASGSTEVEKLVSKDLELAYPATPVEVIKLFGRFNQCMYNTKVEAEEFDALLNQMRSLYSAQLLQQNTFEDHKKNLQEEIAIFSSNKKRIINYTVDKSSSVEYRTIDGQECAHLQMAFFTMENNKYSKVFQDYILIQEGEQWKILAFRKEA